jgi:uncharacterized MnhB-related membrane protein
MVAKIILLIMVVLALIILNTSNLRRAVIYLGIFSLISSFIYLLYGAPDVAIAEAIIGSTITTVLYLVALKKYQIFTVLFTLNTTSDTFPISKNTKTLKEIEHFLSQRNLEPEIIFSKKTCSELLNKQTFDLLVCENDTTIIIYGYAEDYHIDAIEYYLNTKEHKKTIQFHHCKEGECYVA